MPKEYRPRRATGGGGQDERKAKKKAAMEVTNAPVKCFAQASDTVKSGHFSASRRLQVGEQDAKYSHAGRNHTAHAQAKTEDETRVDGNESTLPRLPHQKLPLIPNSYSPAVLARPSHNHAHPVVPATAKFLPVANQSQSRRMGGPAPRARRAKHLRDRSGRWNGTQEGAVGHGTHDYCRRQVTSTTAYHGDIESSVSGRDSPACSARHGRTPTTPGTDPQLTFPEVSIPSTTIASRHPRATCRETPPKTLLAPRRTPTGKNKEEHLVKSDDIATASKSHEQSSVPTITIKGVKRNASRGRGARHVFAMREDTITPSADNDSHPSSLSLVRADPASGFHSSKWASPGEQPLQSSVQKLLASSHGHETTPPRRQVVSVGQSMARHTPTSGRTQQQYPGGLARIKLSPMRREEKKSAYHLTQSKIRRHVTIPDNASTVQNLPQVAVATDLGRSGQSIFPLQTRPDSFSSLHAPPNTDDSRDGIDVSVLSGLRMAAVASPGPASAVFTQRQKKLVVFKGTLGKASLNNARRRRSNREKFKAFLGNFSSSMERETDSCGNDSSDSDFFGLPSRTRQSICSAKEPVPRTSGDGVPARPHPTKPTSKQEECIYSGSSLAQSSAEEQINESSQSSGVSGWLASRRRPKKHFRGSTGPATVKDAPSAAATATTAKRKRRKSRKSRQTDDLPQRCASSSLRASSSSLWRQSSDSD